MSSDKKGSTEDSRTSLSQSRTKNGRKSDHSQSLVSDSEVKIKSKKNETQEIDEWLQSEKHTGQGNDSEESKLSMIFSCLMFCGLITGTDVLWAFPARVLQHGGVYFIVIYLFMLFLIAFPLLHMEVFVGQRCQSGIVKTMRMYGQGFECIGIGVFYLTLLRSLAGVQHSYVLLRHLINIINDPEGIMSCNYEKYKGEIDSDHCASLVDDWNCGDDVFFANRCISDISHVDYTVSVSDFYALQMTTTTKDFDFERLLYNVVIYGIVSAIGIFGFQAIRFFLIFIYGFFVVVFIPMAYPFLNMGMDVPQMLDELSIVTTLESVFKVDTYLTALGLCLVTTGLGLSGILCASSFRPRRGNSFALTYVVIINNIVFCFVSLVYALCMLNVSGYYADATLSPTMERLHFILGPLTELFISQRLSNLWLWSFCFAITLISIKSFCAPLIMVYAFVRDHARRRRRYWNVVAAVMFSVICFVLNISRSFKGMDEKFDLFSDDLYQTTIYLVMAALVVVFIHLYGEREYLIDLCELFKFKEREHPFTSATHSYQFLVFDAVPLAFLVIQIYVTTHVFHPLKKDDFWSVVFKHVLIALISLVVLCFSVRVFYMYIQQQNDLSTLFTVSPEHPSFKRISSGWNPGKEKDSESRQSSSTKRRTEESSQKH